MSGTFDRCCDCIANKCFTVVRRIGGFAEFVITHATTNPVTYFVGRRYKQAQYSFAFSTAGSSCTCAQGSVTPNSVYTSYSFSLNQTFTEMVNIPSANSTGSDAAGGSLQWDLTKFDAGGFYGFYNGGGSSSGCGPGGSYNFGLCPGGYYSGLNNPGSGSAVMVSLSFDEIGCNSAGDFGTPASCASAFYDQSGQMISTCNNPRLFICSGAITNNSSVTGTAGAATGSISGSSFSGSKTVNCVGQQNTSNFSRNTCDPWVTSTIVYSATAAGNLTAEVNYDAVHDSVISAVTTIIGTTAGPSNNWGFNDYPIQGGNWTLSTTPFTGALRAGTYSDGSNIPGAATSTPISSCALTGSGLSLPTRTSVAFAVTWFQIGTEDTPGIDPFDTFICAMNMQAAASTPYILVTYIVMNDFSLILDTYGSGSPCVDGTATGAIWIPQPSAKNLPTSLYGTSGGHLVGPIGRMTVLIPGTTCATWSGTTPA